MLGTITSLLPAIEQWLRLMVLLLSLIATALSVWKLWRGRKDGDRKTGVQMPAVVFIACVLCAVILSACSPSGPRATPVPEEVQDQTTVRASDGQIYRLVRKGRDAGPGLVSEVDLWQPVRQAGQGLPVYTRRLQSASDASDPIMTKAGVLE
jgi:hypothetical protein